MRVHHTRKTLLATLLVLGRFIFSETSFAQRGTVHLIYTSDPHYGIARKAFRGANQVRSSVVLTEMVRRMNLLPRLDLPNDDGVAAGERIGHIDQVIVTGDIANRTDRKYQTAAESWQEFSQSFLAGLAVLDRKGASAPILLSPGNHDISNAIGHYKIAPEDLDPTAMVNIYNRMMRPRNPKTAATYDYKKNKVHYSRDIEGVRLMFINLWPDSAERVWMAKELAQLKKGSPVLLFSHDQPDIEAGHLVNPVPPHATEARTKFENLTTESYKDGNSAADKKSPTTIEQRGLSDFLKAHQNIRAYFHGNENYNEFYTYHGPDHTIDLDVFRVDSPMKGKYSADDEQRLSFQLISIDPVNLRMTVRECFWNWDGKTPIIFGDQKTIGLKTPDR